MSLSKEFHRSPITGKMIRLPQAAEVAPVPQPKPKPESKSNSDWPYSAPYSSLMPPPRMMNPDFQSSALMPPFQMTNPTFQKSENCTFNWNNGNASRYGPPSPNKTHTSSNYSSSHKGHTSNEHHGTHSGRPPYTGHHRTYSPTTRPPNPTTHSTPNNRLSSNSHHQTHIPTNRASKPKPPTAHNNSSTPPPIKHTPNHRHSSPAIKAPDKPCHCHHCTGKREPERQQKPKQLQQQHPTGGQRVKLERLRCEICQIRDQVWQVSGMRVCDGCF